MKKTVAFILALIFVLVCSACKADISQPPNQEKGSLLFQGLEWGIDAQEAMDALGLTKEDLYDSAEEEGTILTFVYKPEEELFGAIPEQAALYFREDNPGRGGLIRVLLVYRGNTQEQVELLKQSLESVYGPLEAEVVERVDQDVQGAEPRLIKHYNDTSKKNFYWNSSQTIADV